MKKDIYAFSGEKGLQSTDHPIIFIHGTGMDHTVWTLPTRYFLRKKRNVLSIDLPGHGRSKGPALDSIPKIADWLMNYLDNLGINTFSIVGHSMGSLIALETSALLPTRCLNLVMVGTAFPMQVSEALLNYAKNNDPKAINILTYLGYSYKGRIGSNTNPGIWMTGSTKKLLERSKKNVIYKDLIACSEYSKGISSAKMYKGQVMLIIGENDYLTPPYKAEDLIDSFKKPLIKRVKDSGHTLLVEKPNQVLDYLIEIL